MAHACVTRQTSEGGDKPLAAAIAVESGGVPFFLEELARGAAGLLPGAGLPEVFVRIWNAWMSGNRDAAALIYDSPVTDTVRRWSYAELLGEVGLGSVKAGYEAKEMVAWARKYGMNSTIHTGGPSIPGSGLIDADVVLEADTDIVGHINGGHTALPDGQIRCICEGCKRGLELVHNGNERAALYTLRLAREMKELNRVILGTDAPAGSGVQPLGILRMVSLLSSLGDVPAEIAFCFATGNTAASRSAARMRRIGGGVRRPPICRSTDNDRVAFHRQRVSHIGDCSAACVSASSTAWPTI